MEERIVQQAKRAGLPIPDRIKNKPRHRADLQIFMVAFAALDSERQIGMTVGMIPWSAIHHYAVVHDFTGELYEDLLYLIPKMDIAVLTKKR